MGRETNISWCHHTFSPWWGCSRVSPGCENCYAEAFDHRLGGEHWQLKGPRKFFRDTTWGNPLRWNAAAAKAGERRRVFCASMADVFEDRPDLVPHRARLWELIKKTPDLDWLLLSKRPENFEHLLPWGANGNPWFNVWLGVTAENDEYAKKRIWQLQRTPATKRFISYEPALGPIDWRDNLDGINWVIFGDESGRNRRPAEIEWARQTRDACAESGVAYHLKQWCGDLEEGVDGDRIKKKIHLPMLDGQRHAEFPT